jgi:hypothetical protein
VLPLREAARATVLRDAWRRPLPRFAVRVPVRVPARFPALDPARVLLRAEAPADRERLLLARAPPRDERREVPRAEPRERVREAPRLLPEARREVRTPRARTAAVSRVTSSLKFERSPPEVSSS